MKDATDRGLRRWRAAALLAVGVAIGVMVVATPAVSHVGGTVSHLWNQHIKPKADARYVRSVDTVVQSGNVVITSGVQTSTGTASCAAGEKILGGGAEGQSLLGFTTTPSIVYSKPVTTMPRGWTAQISAASNDDWWVRVYAVCAPGS